MIINATQIRVGQVLKVNGELYKVTYMQHVTPGKGQAVIQTKLKNIINNKNLEYRFRSNEKAEKADLETQNMQYLYSDPDGLIMMNTETFDQLSIEKSLIGEQEHYLQEGEIYPVTLYESQAVGIELPQTVTLKVTVAPPEIKKATATNSLRPITLENGMKVNAPAFIKEGDLIKVNTETHEYIERTK